MKKNEFFKRVIDNNIVDKERILKNTLSNYNEDKKYGSSKHTMLSFRLTAVFLAFIVILGYNLLKMKPTSVSKTFNNMDSSKVNKSNNYFKVFACAVDNKVSANDGKLKIDESKKIELKVNTEREVPYGKIAQGKLVSYVNKKGEEIKEYEVNFEADFRLVCDASNIKSATFTSINGELYYCDDEMFKKMEDNGEVSFKLQQRNSSYIHRGSKIKVYGNKGEIVLDWNPVKSMDILQKENFYNNYEKLPSDTITAEVEFEDGQVIRKSINLSFNKEGNLVVEVKK